MSNNRHQRHPSDPVMRWLRRQAGRRRGGTMVSCSRCAVKRTSINCAPNCGNARRIWPRILMARWRRRRDRASIVKGMSLRSKRRSRSSKAHRRPQRDGGCASAALYICVCRLTRLWITRTGCCKRLLLTSRCSGCGKKLNRCWLRDMTGKRCSLNLRDCASAFGRMGARRMKISFSTSWTS